MSTEVVKTVKVTQKDIDDFNTSPLPGIPPALPPPVHALGYDTREEKLASLGNRHHHGATFCFIMIFVFTCLSLIFAAMYFFTPFNSGGVLAIFIISTILLVGSIVLLIFLKHRENQLISKGSVAIQRYRLVGRNIPVESFE